MRPNDHRPVALVARPQPREQIPALHAVDGPPEGEVAGRLQVALPGRCHTAVRCGPLFLGHDAKARNLDTHPLALRTDLVAFPSPRVALAALAVHKDASI